MNFEYREAYHKYLDVKAVVKRCSGDPSTFVCYELWVNGHLSDDMKRAFKEACHAAL